MFWPDVATSSRATFGGMISNNSSGARAPVYGTTVDRVVSLDVVLPDGTTATIGMDHPALEEKRAFVDALVQRHAEAIREHCPPGLFKRWPGYGLDRYARSGGDLTRLVGGSEGTLAAIVGAELALDPLPRQTGLGLIFFGTVQEAMQATVELKDLEPAAIEHVDRLLFDQTTGQRAFRATRELLRLDDDPAESILLVEFYEGAEDRLAELTKRGLGLRTYICKDAKEAEKVWAMRKAGLSLLTGRKGAAKPVTGLEDVAVQPERLPAYVEGVRALLEPLGLQSSFYGHCASGLVHIRPIIDLHNGEDIAKFRNLADGVSALVREFKGSLCAEHGVGIARAEFLEEHIGAELLGAMREVKALFDPAGLMNPGKVLPDGRFHIDTHLRWGAGHAIPLPFEPRLAFARKDESFIGNLEQCNGCGQCLKDIPSMCPTYLATGDEIMSTRGRANTIRAALEGRIDEPGGPLSGPALYEALSNCLSCKACKTECPSNVDLALLKAELVHARQRRDGVGLCERLVSRFDLLGKLGCLTPGIANATLNLRPVRLAMEKFVGIASDRPLPSYTRERFDRWFTRRGNGRRATRGRIILWDDCSVRYHEPAIGKSAVAVLEAAGYEVVLPKGHACCGRPAFSVGRLDVAARFGARNVALLTNDGADTPIVFLEPSCYSMFSEDYRELGVPGAEDVAGRCVLFEQFVHNLLEQAPHAIALAPMAASVAIHGHCHAKALTDVDVMPELAGRIPESRVKLLDTGCCGMAGSFGALRDKYELSVRVAQPMVDLINDLEPGTKVVASGTSCRQQIKHLTRAEPVHMAELLAAALVSES